MDLLNSGLRDGPEERSHHGPVVDVDAGGAPADGVDPRQPGGGLVKPGHDLMVMVGRVGLVPGVPGDLLAEDGLPIHDGAHLAVARAEVEPDAAAVQVTAERPGLLVGGRHAVGRGGLDDELPVIGGRHQVGVETPAAPPRVRFLQELGHFRGTADDDLIPAPHPEQRLDQAFGIPEPGFEQGVRPGKHGRFEPAQRAVGPLETDDQRHGSRRRDGGLPEGPVPEHGGRETGMKAGYDGRPCGVIDGLVHEHSLG